MSARVDLKVSGFMERGGRMARREGSLKAMTGSASPAKKTEVHLICVFFPLRTLFFSLFMDYTQMVAFLVDENEMGPEGLRIWKEWSFLKKNRGVFGRRAGCPTDDSCDGVCITWGRFRVYGILIVVSITLVGGSGGGVCKRPRCWSTAPWSAGLQSTKQHLLAGERWSWVASQDKQRGWNKKLLRRCKIVPWGFVYEILHRCRRGSVERAKGGTFEMW